MKIHIRLPLCFFAKIAFFIMMFSVVAYGLGATDKTCWVMVAVGLIFFAIDVFRD